jgi:hypothetical protein
MVGTSGQRLRALAAEQGERPRLAALDLRQAGRHRRDQHLRIVAEQRGQCRSAALGRQMPQLHPGRGG